MAIIVGCYKGVKSKEYGDIFNLSNIKNTLGNKAHKIERLSSFLLSYVVFSDDFFDTSNLGLFF